MVFHNNFVFGWLPSFDLIINFIRFFFVHLIKKIMEQPKVSKEIQHAGVEIVKVASDEILKDWKPRTLFGRISKFIAKTALSIGVGITTKNINKQ